MEDALRTAVPSMSPARWGNRIVQYCVMSLAQNERAIAFMAMDI